MLFELQKIKIKLSLGFETSQIYWKNKKILFPITSRLSGASKLRKYVIWQDFFSRAIQIRVLSKKQKFTYNPNYQTKICFFPLHKQPEASTSPMGGSFVYQDLAINVLLEGLDVDTLIYVKPHVLKGTLHKFLERIEKHEKIVLIDQSVNSFDLMKNSIAVATVTGTVGWEAFLNDKPVLMFGKYFYKGRSNVYTVSSSDDVRAALLVGRKIRQMKERTNQREAFLMAVQESTFKGWVDNRYAEKSSMSHEENNSSLAAEFLKKLNN